MSIKNENFTATLKAIRTEVKSIAGVYEKTMGKQIVSGYTWFSEGDRICKLMNTSDSKSGIIEIEINVDLDKKWEEVPGFKFISRATAKKKHLGTMKSLFRSKELAKVEELVKEIVASFKNPASRTTWKS